MMEYISENGVLFAGLAITSSIKMSALLLMWNRRPVQAKEVGRVSQLLIYPVKSCQGISLKEAEVTGCGLRIPGTKVTDRHFMIISENGVFTTQRQIPRMALIKPSVHGDCLHMDAPDMTTLKIQLKFGPKSVIRKSKVWGEQTVGVDCGDEAATWISDFIGQSSRLIYSAENLPKRHLLDLNTKERNRLVRTHDVVAYPDFAAYHLMNEASLEDFNTRTEKKVDERTFRPNIMIKGSPAYSEDKWNKIYIGDQTKFYSVNIAPRCTLVNVNPDTGKKDPDSNVTKTLKEYRILKELNEPSPVFNIGMFKEYGDIVKVGDPVFAIYK